MKLRFIWLSTLLFGCEGTLSDVIGSDWGSNVGFVDSVDSIAGDLSDGAMLAHLDWADASSVACWPGTENVNWTGNHVFYATTQAPNSNLIATVIPATSDVDVNVYILQQGTTSYQVPPDVTSVVSCEAGFPQSTDSNPGEEDSTYVTASTNEYNILIGVGGPEGAISGGYTLDISLEDN